MTPQLSSAARLRLHEYTGPGGLDELLERWEDRRRLSPEEASELEQSFNSRLLEGSALEFYELDGLIFVCDDYGAPETVVSVVQAA